VKILITANTVDQQQAGNCRVQVKRLLEETPAAISLMGMLSSYNHTQLPQLM
jgi:hypothetical protein